MAGIWERVKPEGLDGDGGDRVSTHVAQGCWQAYVANNDSPPNGLDLDQIKAALNTDLVTPLDAAELADVDGIAAFITSLPSTLKQIIATNNVDAMWLLGEAGIIDEAKFRSDLGI